MVHEDDASYGAAGGNLAKLALYRQAGSAAVFSNGSDRCMAAIHPSLPEIGAVGDWVGGAEVREAAEAWLRSQGATKLRGPMELCTWFPYRAVFESGADAPFLLEPTESPQRWEEAGYTPVYFYRSVLLDHHDMIRSAMNRAASLSARGWQMETLDVDDQGRVTEAAWRAGIDLVHEIAHAAFADAFGFAPVSREVMQAWYAPYRAMVDADLIHFARSPEGRVAGLAFGYADPTHPDWVVFKTLAVHPDFHGTGVGTWLSGRLHQASKARGATHLVWALMADDAGSTHMSAENGRVLRRYVLLEKPA